MAFQSVAPEARKPRFASPLCRILCLAAILAFRPVGMLVETGFLDRNVILDGKSYRYMVYVPAEYTPGKAWPVVVDLHGNGTHGTDGLSHTQFGMAVAIRQNRAAFPVIVVFPQAPPDEYWEQIPMQKLIVVELDATEHEFSIDRSREYLTGFSMGAAGAYRLAYHWPLRFAAVATIAGSIDPIPAGHGANNRAEIDRRTNAFTAEPDPFAALAARIKSVPLWIFHGDADSSVAVRESRLFVAALRQINAEVRYTEYPGAGHTGAAAKAYTEPELMTWLLSHKRAN